MKAMCLFSYSSSAPRTVQYQSTICGRRLVCSTRCDSFFGDAMVLLPGAGDCAGIGAWERRRSQQECGRAAPCPAGSYRPEEQPRRGNRAEAHRTSAAALFLLVDLAQVALEAGALHRVPLAVHAGTQLLRFAAQPTAPLAPIRAVARLAVPWPYRRSLSTAAEVACERAVAVADIANAAINPGKGTALLAAIARPAPRNQRIPF